MRIQMRFIFSSLKMDILWILLLFFVVFIIILFLSNQKVHDISLPVNEEAIFLTCGDDQLFDLSNQSIVPCQKKELWNVKGFTSQDLAQLGRDLDITYPWNRDYYWLRENYQKRNLPYPMGIVRVRNLDDLKFIWNIVREHKLPFRIRSGGHSYENLSLSGGLVIDCSLLREFHVDEKGIATVGAGMEIDHVITGLANHGLAIPTGTCPNVGLTGLTLGGGIGLLLRKYGLTCDWLVGVEMMLADGQVLTIKRGDDLFWACQGGGGGNFGIVTKLMFKTIPIERVTWFDITWDRKYFKEIFSRWQTWGPDTVPELSTVFHIDNFPERIKLEGLFFGNEDKLLSLLRPFLNLYDGKLFLKSGNYLESGHFFATRPGFPFFKAKSSFFTKNLSGNALDLIEKAMNKRLTLEEDSPIGFGLYIPAFGGVNNQITSDETAFPWRKCRYWIQFSIHWSDPLQEKVCFKWIEQLYDSLTPFMPHQAYVNCPDLELPDAKRQYYGDNLERLEMIKKRYDPENIFVFPQSL